MDPHFWRERWKNNQIGFHQHSTHHFLEKHWEKFCEDRKPSVFIPLCGKSLDIHWLHDHGHEVTGIELSTIAIQNFFEEAHLCPKKTEVNQHNLYNAKNINLFEGDIFDLSNEQIKTDSVIYDRAALIALPENMRLEYVEKLRALFPSSSIFLVTLEYPQDEMDGPPFSVTRTEIDNLYKGCNIQEVEKIDILVNEERFQEKGISELHECLYFIKPI